MVTHLNRRQFIATGAAVAAPLLLPATNLILPSKASEPTPVGDGERPIVVPRQIDYLPEHLLHGRTLPIWRIDHTWAFGQFQSRQPPYELRHSKVDFGHDYHVARLPFFLQRGHASYFPPPWAPGRYWGEVQIVHVAIVNKVTGITKQNVFFYSKDKNTQFLG